jgi:hypothetical protein
MRSCSRSCLLLAGAILYCGTQAGCVFPTGDFTIISAQGTSFESRKLVSDAEGEACANRLLGVIPLGNKAASLAEAVDDAMAKAPEANVMTDIEADVSVTNFLLANRSCIRVKGDLGVVK